MEVFGRDLLRYGEIISIDDFISNNKYNTIRVIKYDNSVYKHHMINGEIVDVKKII